MCWDCDYKSNASLVTANPSTILSEQPRSKQYRAKLAREQRANYETAKQYRFLCEKHLANYELVVQALERTNEHADY